MARFSALCASSTCGPATVLLRVCASATVAAALNWLVSACCWENAWLRSVSATGVRFAGELASAW